MRRLKLLLARTFEEWNKHDATMLAASLAYYSVLSLAPLLVVAVAITGEVFRKEIVQQRILAQVTSLVGSAGADAFKAVLANAQSPKASLIAGAVGLVVSLFSASAVFTALRKALNQIWGVKRDRNSGWWEAVKEQLVAVAMVVGIGILLLILISASVALTALTRLIANSAPTSMPGIVGNVVTVIGVAILFAVLYRFVPEETLPWSRLWPGSLATALLFLLGKYLLGLYIRRTSIGSAYGAAGSLVVLLAWVYYSSLLFLLGAEFTRVFACREEGSCLNMGQDSPTPVRRAS